MVFKPKFSVNQTIIYTLNNIKVHLINTVYNTMDTRIQPSQGNNNANEHKMLFYDGCQNTKACLPADP